MSANWFCDNCGESRIPGERIVNHDGHSMHAECVLEWDAERRFEGRMRADMEFDAPRPRDRASWSDHGR